MFTEFFREFIAFLRPSYATVMPHRTWLATTGLDDLYAEVKKLTTSKTSSLLGYASLSTDGWKNVARDHVINFVFSRAGHDTYCDSVNTRENRLDAEYQVLMCHIVRYLYVYVCHTP